MGGEGEWMGVSGFPFSSPFSSPFFSSFFLFVQYHLLFLFLR